MRDEVYKGGGKVLGTGGTIAVKGEVDGDGDDDDDKDPKKIKDSSLNNKTPEKKKPSKEEEEEFVQIASSIENTLEKAT